MAGGVKFGVSLSSPDGYQRFNDELTMINHLESSDTDARNNDNNGSENTKRNNRGELNCSINIRNNEIELGHAGSHDINSELNYHEAAIYLEEGENNEKFDSHPHDTSALPAYLLVHNAWFYNLDLFTSIVLLLLAFCEEPAVSVFELPSFMCTLIEITCLSVIAIEMGLKLRWMGWLTILKHKRTLIKGLLLIIMFLEAFVVLIRDQSHFRITRCFRPIFLLDTHHLGVVRRFIRQIFQSVPPIFDMLCLILVFVSIYALLGFFLFSPGGDNEYFATLYDSFVSMFVLLTTANFPDIMMPSYSKSRWYSLFFISYLCVVLYILMNMMLAVVYETFTTVEREKMKKLHLHKHKACRMAFDLLTIRGQNELRFDQFRGLIKYYAPKKSDLDVITMFKYLNEDNNGFINFDGFYKVYDAVIMKWEPQYAFVPWYHSKWMPLQNVCQIAFNISNHPYCEGIFYLVTVFNALIMADRAFNMESNFNRSKESLERSLKAFSASWDTTIVCIACSCEIGIKMLGHGMKAYFSSGWNIFDFVSTILTSIGIVMINIWPTFVYAIVFRPLKLFKLFKLKKQYRDIIGTVALLTPLFKSAFIVMLLVYYFFAIIGMELFSKFNMKNCCKGTTVEDFYKYRGIDDTSSVGFYYLNTFANLSISLVTLFELTIVNNWFIVMNGYASVTLPISRLYFIMFYLFTMIVLTILVASILEAFRFRIQYKRQTSKRDEEKMLHEEVDVKWDEVTTWVQDFQLLERLRPELVVGGTATFIGSRPRSREVLQRRMYQSEIDRWLKEAVREEQ